MGHCALSGLERQGEESGRSLRSLTAGLGVTAGTFATVRFETRP